MLLQGYCMNGTSRHVVEVLPLSRNSDSEGATAWRQQQDSRRGQRSKTPKMRYTEQSTRSIKRDVGYNHDRMSLRPYRLFLVGEVLRLAAH